MKTRALLSLTLLLCSGAFAQTLDTFEGASTPWKAGMAPNYSDSSAQGTLLSTTHPSEGQQSLELQFQTGQPKAIFFAEGTRDLTGNRYLQFDLFNPGTAGSVAVALSTGSSWEWFESEAVPLKNGSQTVSFDLQGQGFKNARNNWNFGVGLENLAKTERIAVLVFPTTAGSVFLDHLRLSGDAPAQPATGETAAPQAPSTQAPSAAEPAPQTPPASNELQLQVPAGATVLKGLELTLQTGLTFKNPYDPAEADLQVTITTPSGKKVQVPAFYSQDFDPDTLQPRGEGGWKVRYTPLEAGNHTAQAMLSGKNLQSAPVAFSAAANPSAKGFVRVDASNPRYFRHDNGDFFLPIGLNIAWSVNSGKGALDDYRRWFDRFAANGGNLARLWMPAWGFGIEWKDTGLGNYQNRQLQAYLLDQVFKMAEERGIQIELCLLNHGQFSETTNPEWEDNPYNRKNGGMLDRPGDFVTDPQAIGLFKQRVRYIAARYSYSPNLFAWEWWNEVNWTPISDTDLRTWIPEMTRYLLALDPNQHMVSSSHSSGTSTSIWDLPELSFSQQHDYSGRDAGRFLVPSFNDMADISPNKPVLLAEIGYSAGGADDLPVSRDEIQLHNSLWSAPLSGFASTGMYWWWDNFIDPRNLWTHYKGVSEFFQGEDLSRLKRFRPGNSDLLGTVALGMKNDSRALLWVRNNLYEPGAVIKAINEALIGGTFNDQWKHVPEPVTDLEITVPDLKDGQYQVQTYDPQQNLWTGTQTLTTTAGVLTLKVASLSKDLAFKVTPAP